MALLEHFYIRPDKQAGTNGWPVVYTYVQKAEAQLQTLNCDKPNAGSNIVVLKEVRDILAHLDTLLSQQALVVSDLNEPLGKTLTTVTAILGLYDDEDYIDLITPRRLRELKDACAEHLLTVIEAANKQNHRAQAQEQNDVEPEVDDTQLSNEEIFKQLDDDKPILSANASFDNFREAARTMLSQMRDNIETREQTEQVILTPQQRLFLEIQRHIEATLSNFGTAASKLGREADAIQFASGTLALQGRFDRKGLSGVQHSLVQIGNLRLSAKVSDSMIPTLFLHGQRFGIFRQPEIRLYDHYVNESMERALFHSPPNLENFLLKPLRHKLFPNLLFVWLADSALIKALDLRTTIKAELSL